MLKVTEKNMAKFGQKRIATELYEDALMVTWSEVRQREIELAELDIIETVRYMNERGLLLNSYRADKDTETIYAFEAIFTRSGVAEYLSVDDLQEDIDKLLNNTRYGDLGLEVYMLNLGVTSEEDYIIESGTNILQLCLFFNSRGKVLHDVQFINRTEEGNGYMKGPNKILVFMPIEIKE